MTATLTDSAVWSGEAGGALAQEPVDSVHADPAVVTEEGTEKRVSEREPHPVQLQQKPHHPLFVCVHKVVLVRGGGRGGRRGGGVTGLNSAHQYQPQPFRC